MNDFDDTRLIGMLRRVVRDCGKLYKQCGTWMVRRFPTLLEGDAGNFVELMDDLHRGLLIKVYVTVVRADNRWSVPEKKVAAAMIEHLWDQELRGNELREAATELFQQADLLKWEALVAPFVRYEPLADSKSHVETVVMRLANLVAKCDGELLDEESVALHTLQREIDMALYPADPKAVLAPLAPSTEKSKGKRATESKEKGNQKKEKKSNVSEPVTEAEREQRLAVAMKELDELIGLDSVKERVKSYTNFLRLQTQRRDAGLTTMPISLHMSFVGNPGTGKTTVARIVGQILGALGTLSSGHVVETDRSGLVAEYAGQTAPKTNELCDSAMHGILFIDEAYSLVDASGDDAYGREAVQCLLKRMEDDREAVAVILAGYSNEMKQLIRSNPGLSSRVNTTIEFEDYTPRQLGQIFEYLCEQNQYAIPSDARHRVLMGFHYLYEKRDRHFGNGRLVRNVFEDSVRRLADRLADATQLTESLLTTLLAIDISFPELDEKTIDALLSSDHVLRTKCEKCSSAVRIQPDSLGRRIKCGKCSHVQAVGWADVEEV
ncbi:AAA family ATPase [bacterium]|nr:AAA family ATPase [bacterium]